MSPFNVYEDLRRAEAYAALEFPGTYYLAYRDLPALLAEHVRGTRALDFGCGAGRSTRFLRGLGFAAVGVDVSEEMIRRAAGRDPGGDYRLIANGDLGQFPARSFDLVLSAFTFDNIPGREKKVALFEALGGLLSDSGRIVSVVSAPEIYTHEWASFSTRDFPENRAARCGDPVRIIMTDVEDRRPVVDIVWPDEAYREVYAAAGLEVVTTHRPLGREDEPIRWVNETRVAPWVIYLLRRAR
ncbi:MAG: methyltransferase domain-containing protein [Candidatus Eisenbacteria bacterium]|nr:methyltransferase domain-containing protein [Candidatus Eisenbacteria bacterium]